MLRDDLSRYESAGVQVLAISCDTAPAQKKWAEEEGYNFPVLADFWPHGKVAQDYGVFNDKLGCAMRHTFLIDTNGVIVDHFDTEAISVPREQARFEEALTKL
jgi:peroxiredoxin